MSEGDNSNPASINNSSPAQLRHSLRTPLNHVIGYSEMLLEDVSGEAEPENREAIRERLNALVFNARELVKFIQNALAGDKMEITSTDLHDLQFWLKGHVVQLLEDTNALEAVAPPVYRDDVGKIRFAADRLMAFTEGRPGALSDSQLQEAVSSGLPAGAEASILVVDDNAGNRDILKRHLERQGYNLTLASNGVQALQVLSGGSFDLVLLDVIMPELDGFSVLQQMKASAALNTTPVIMISALDESQSVIRCIQMGAEDYLMKPFDPVLLTARIGASLEKKRLRDRERRRPPNSKRPWPNCAAPRISLSPRRSWPHWGR